MSYLEREEKAFAEYIIERRGDTSQTTNAFYVMANRYLSMDKSKGFANDLGTKELAKILRMMADWNDMRCFYTGELLTLECGCYNKVSFDRIDNSKGHTVDNMVMTSKLLNIFRGDMEFDKFLEERPWEKAAKKWLRRSE
tara:strand:- start:25 stop:444 length:420 start_codon:yes stop_codon:yes gene_type:complete